MVNQHRRQTSIPRVRLRQPLPPLPLPLDDIPPRLSIATQIPYRDDPENEDEEDFLSARSPSQPPRYEPMHDYLRSRQQMIPQAPICPSNTNERSSSEEPYRDEPFVVTILDLGEDASQPPPPSYNDLYRQNEAAMENLLQEFDVDGTPAEQTEMLCKWIVAMLLVALTVACVGTVYYGCSFRYSLY